MQTSDYPAAAVPQGGEPNPGLRAAALTAVVAGMVVVAGAAFVLSYQGIHQIVLNAGVSPELARLYPVMLDAMLVMSCAAALALRTAGLWTRCYVWACLILLIVGMATGNALHAMNISLPAQPTRAVVAVLPWALLLLGFGMLLAMLRHWRQIRVASAPADPARAGNGVAAGATLGAVSWAGSTGSEPAKPDAPRAGIKELMGPRTGEPPDRAGAVAAGAAGAAAAIAAGEAADGKRPSPATSAEGTGASGRDDAASRPPATPPEKDDPDIGPAVSYEAEPVVPAGTAGSARANGPAGTPRPAGGTKPGPATQPAADDQPGGDSRPAAPAGAAGTGPAPGSAGADVPAGAANADGLGADTPPGAPAAPVASAATATPTAGNVRLVTPPADGAATATPPARTVPMTTPPDGSAAAPPVAAAATPPAGAVPAASPSAGTVPAGAAPADAGPQPQGTTVPFLERILGGPTDPNTPGSDGG